MATRTLRFLRLSAVLLPVVVFGGFCLITNSQGAHRKYLDSTIPFVYRLHTSTPEAYTPAIERGGMSWNNVQSSYFEFARGTSTAATGPGMDGVNLVFFDLQGINFPPPTNVIAFSQTFTSSAGGIYRAVESDLVWNARDFTPSPTGAPGQQDLESVIAHEFGHHLGLDHTGIPSGASSGCGPHVQAATMWWASSPGDTTKRSLHPEDLMGVSVLYPVWVLQGVVTDQQSMPVEGAPLIFLATHGSEIGGVIQPNFFYNRPGYLLDTIRTNTSGQYSTVVLDQSFDVIVDGFGYERDSARIHFNPPGGIGQTQTITHNVQITPTPSATFSGSVRDAGTLAPIPARIEFYGVGDPEGMSGMTTTGPDGLYAITLPSKERYDIRIYPDAPYEDIIEHGPIHLSPSGASLELELLPAQVLLVDDDAGASYDLYYVGAIDRTGMRRRTFDVSVHGTTPASVLATFPQRPVVIWFTGNDSTTAFTAGEKAALMEHLDAGGRAIISGQNIAQSLAADDPLLAGMFGIRFDGNTSSVFLRGFASDIIGNGVNTLITGGAPNQNSKDILALVPGSTGTPTPTLYYNVGGGDTTRFAGVRVEGPGGWAVTYFSLGLEGLSPARMDTLLVRSFRYFDGISVSVADDGGGMPGRFSVEQNYPNPFNPSTRIPFSVWGSGLPAVQARFVSLKVYDILGREVRTLVNQNLPPGSYEVTFDAEELSSGVYLYRLQAGAFAETKKMILAR